MLVWNWISCEIFVLGFEYPLRVRGNFKICVSSENKKCHGIYCSHVVNSFRIFLTFLFHILCFTRTPVLQFYILFLSFIFSHILSDNFLFLYLYVRSHHEIFNLAMHFFFWIFTFNELKIFKIPYLFVLSIVSFLKAVFFYIIILFCVFLNMNKYINLFICILL